MVTKAVAEYQLLDRSERNSEQPFRHSYFWSLFQSLNLSVTDFDDVETENSVFKRLISCSVIDLTPA